MEACKYVNVFEGTSSLFYKLKENKFLGNRTKIVGLYCLGIKFRLFELFFIKCDSLNEESKQLKLKEFRIFRSTFILYNV